ncbi:unnamed protein product [Pocillopora meandrina]|uniref:DUF4371 domain-containing protein n=1 Tax=Pocillopora meandrina TaxID=46732 RepID=A0AAU9WSG5_9CNID|nr:unnamed protein product [Pocillopora meandrina]
MAMLSLLATENSVLREHLENAPRISKYTCPDIQNEIIFFSAKQILDGLIDNCKRSVIYALIADESTDVTNNEEISICIRFVDRKEDGKHLISEEFLTFVHADKGSNAEELTTKLLETIQSVIVDTLDQLSEEGDSKARALHASILKWDCIITLVVLQHIFEYTNKLLVCLQNPDLELIQASEEAKTCLSVLNAERNDNAVWEALMEKAIEIASDYGIDPSSPRTAGRQQHHNNVPADTPSAYWKRAMYLPFLDHLVTEINEKLVVPLPGFEAQLLIPGKLGLLTEEKIEVDPCLLR